MGVNPWWVDMKLGCQYKSHKGRAAIRHYANQPFNQEKALEGAFSVIVKSSETFG